MCVCARAHTHTHTNKRPPARARTHAHTRACARAHKQDRLGLGPEERAAHFRAALPLLPDSLFVVDALALALRAAGHPPAAQVPRRRPRPSVQGLGPGVKAPQPASPRAEVHCAKPPHAPAVSPPPLIPLSGC